MSSVSLNSLVYLQHTYRIGPCPWSLLSPASCLHCCSSSHRQGSLDRQPWMLVQVVKQTNKQKFKVRQPQRAAKSKRPNAPADGSKNNGINVKAVRAMILASPQWCSMADRNYACNPAPKQASIIAWQAFAYTWPPHQRQLNPAWDPRHSDLHWVY